MLKLLYTTLQRILCDTPMLEALHIYTVDPLLEQHNLTALHVHIMCGLHSCTIAASKLSNSLCIFKKNILLHSQLFSAQSRLQQDRTE